MSKPLYSLFVSCSKGLDYLLEAEIKALGLSVTQMSHQGVYCDASLEQIYELCLWSRLASRVLLILFRGEAADKESLYTLCREYPWQTLFSGDKTLAIDFNGSTPALRNTMFGAQVIKDAIVDYFQSTTQQRPQVDKESPQVRLHAQLKHNTVTVSFDLTGYSLHQRGYRKQAGLAPLKENLAAALLARSQWPQKLANGFGFMDPCCGSGTLAIEAAMIATNKAPGLFRQDQAFQHWTEHQPELWRTVRTAAAEKEHAVALKLYASDSDLNAIEAARANAMRAGVADAINFEVKSLSDCTPFNDKGLLISNPPFGERLGDALPLMPFYQELGRVLHTHFQQWEAAILTSNPLLAKAIGLRSNKQYNFYNGALACQLYYFQLEASNRLNHAAAEERSDSAQMFANRLKKNSLHLKKWVKRNQISCYRVYDADLPEYAYAIDIYNDYAVLQEYKAPADIPLQKTEQRSLDVLKAVPDVLGITADKLIVKQRQAQKGLHQYQKMNHSQKTMVVQENAAKFIVNLQDYLDTGLFLDNRLLRQRFASLPKGTRFLNCFCYTASASVHAALAGAITTNVDLSNTYLQWAEDNFRQNRIDLSKHQFVQYDCKEWLHLSKDRYDVIFLDPPSFSNSKRMQDTLDIQRDHESLIDAAMHLLTSSGTLYFSTNLRRFKLSTALEERYDIHDITKETIDLDFKRNSRIHQCFTIRKLTS